MGPFLIQGRATEHRELPRRDVFCSTLAHTKKSSLGT